VEDACVDDKQCEHMRCVSTCMCAYKDACMPSVRHCARVPHIGLRQNIVE
jgi:hypothetical protein